MRGIKVKCPTTGSGFILGEVVSSIFTHKPNWFSKGELCVYVRLPYSDALHLRKVDNLRLA